MAEKRIRYCTTVPANDPNVQLKKSMKWETLSGKLDLSAVRELFPEYVWIGNPWERATIGRAYGVEYYRGTFHDRPAYFIVKNRRIRIFCN